MVVKGLLLFSFKHSKELGRFAASAWTTASERLVYQRHGSFLLARCYAKSSTPVNNEASTVDMNRRYPGIQATPTATATSKNISKDHLEDFKCTLVTKLDESQILERFQNVKEEDRPLVLLFGWAGATQKNLSKYSDVYQRAGCYTLGYNLPSRFVFTITSDIPVLAEEILRMIEAENLLNRPIFLHLMSDTGMMVYQGLDIVLKDQSKKIEIVGAILDSCPGPIPKVTIPRVLAIGIVNWICCTKDGLGIIGCLKETSRFLALRVIPNLLRKFKGLPVELSLMQNTWAGDFYRKLQGKHWPELFLYSKTDFYLPWSFLEQEVLKPRKDECRDVRAVRWDKSPHVQHLRAHRSEYEKAVYDFLYDKYFITVKKSE